MKKFFTLFLLGVMTSATLFVGEVSAQQGQASHAQAVKVADVSISNASIVSQQGNTLTISFTLNNGEMLQSGVRYGVALLETKGDTQMTVDEMVYDEALTLAEGSTVTKQIIYTAPEIISGTYTVAITSRNSNGFPFGVASAGTVTLEASVKGVMIAGDTCYGNVSSEPKSFRRRILDSTTLADKNTLTLVCTATNTANTPISVLPSFETQYVGAYGTTITAEGGDMNPIVFAAGEKKEISILLPKATKPQMYAVGVTLGGLNTASNTITAYYYIPGARAVVVNANLDKDVYYKGETATLRILWSGDQAEVMAKISIKNDIGQTCVKQQDFTLATNSEGPFSTVTLPVLRDCFGPKLTITLSDTAGTVLDEQVFMIETASVERPGISWKLAALLLGGIVLVLVLAIIIRRNRNTENYETTV